MSLLWLTGHLLRAASPPTASNPELYSTAASNSPSILTPTSDFVQPKQFLWPNFLSLALSLALSSPSPSLAAPPPFLASSTPFSQSKNLPTGLENGKIRPCPSINPGCVSTNPQSSSFAFPWIIPENSSGDAIKQLQDAILKTQKNVKIQDVEDTPHGQYLQAEIDGGFGRDVIEFLVKGDVVSYRGMATKVIYVYPFTTAFGDSKGQEERMKKILEQLGWSAPSFDYTEY